MANGPLHGVRVLEFSQIVAAPFLGCILADLGADVVKVERPEGDPHRLWGSVVPGEAKRFQSLNRNKRGIVVDLQQEAGRALVHRLVPAFDIVTMNYRYGLARRLGVDYEQLRELRPDIIYCELTGWGPDGPLASNGSVDPVATAFAGLIAGEGKLDAWGQPATVDCAPLGDLSCALAGAAGVLSALYHRAMTGEGQKVETSLLRSSIALQPYEVMREPVSDAVVRDPMLEDVRRVRERGGGYEEVIAARSAVGSDSAAWRGFHMAYATKDGVVQLGAVTPRTRAGVRELLGITDDPSDDPDFDALDPDSIAYAETRVAHIREAFASQTSAEIIERFTEAGVPVGPVNLPEELSDHPQIEAMGLMAEVEHAVTGPQRVVGPLVTLSKTPSGVRRASPALGADTDTVLREAGLSEEEIGQLRSDHVVA